MFANGKEHKYPNNPGTRKRIDSAKGAGEVAYNEKSDTHTPKDNFNWKIRIDYSDLKIFKNNESLLCEVLQNKFNCLSTLVSPVQEGSSKSQQVFRKMLTPKLQLTVWKDDLTRHAVDVVVNAANEDLEHAGGLALALVKAGGIEIQEESRRFISQNGRVIAGNIALTKAGKLPCKSIIHAVGPCWTESDRQTCINLLYTVTKNILLYATNSHIESIAIPAVSSGVFRFPLNLCTDIIVGTIRTHFQQYSQTSNLKEIHLVSNEDPTVNAFKTSSEAILGKNELEPCVRQEEMIVGGLTLQIVQGCIEMQQTDVIVNSIYSCADLQAGPLSKSILSAAGNEMELELSYEMTKASHDSVLVTKGFNMSCQYVFHVLWSFSQYYDRTQILLDAMKNCLQKCDTENVTSISFPALGTGSIGLNKSLAANIMFDAVLNFTKHLSKPLTVKFVIFTDDLETYKVFWDEMARRKSMLQTLNNYNVSQWTGEKRENELTATFPAINLMGCNLEKMNEAQAWIQRMLSFQNDHVIENNYILYLGKKEHRFLSQLQKTLGISITEIIYPGNTKLEIKGAKADLTEVVIKIENMLCEVQAEMTRKKEQDLWNIIGQRTNQQSKYQDGMEENKFLKCLSCETQEIRDRKKEFEKCGLSVVKVEKIQNDVLENVFLKKKLDIEKRMNGKPVSHRLFQRVPYQYCKMICRVGFQRLCSVPCEPKFGDGIYFMKDLKGLASQIKATPATDKFIYVFEAEVLTGSICQGQQSIISPPSLIPGSIESHDSVVDNVSKPEIFVIFSGMQAKPRYLWTCTQSPVKSQVTAYSPWPWSNFSGGSSVD
ncbi:protein mono-ADP-ribosyltransferase PARP9 isoform X1 [Erinaceus europaeus]|uniref:Protein mono-ADP-ribosyltransferase PARP9 isoform X1 n=1 Tax=Erinaceus europaeus TaxID=9365 RepID=A0A1S3WPJ3_ERIEU|nr:protein mono-ADP-ribosyltransferase PARP9 isoform X1 [Erinaceus europaeus]XP_060054250.1 protein mono-ADP-ribosyltransferase PARP9 isoform X1 [Erinaceus europaeus]